jgi:hypothetical protein
VLANNPLDLAERVDLRVSHHHASVIELKRTECCPTVVLEAIAVCQSVGTQARGGIVDLLDHGITRILVDPSRRVALSKVARTS